MMNLWEMLLAAELTAPPYKKREVATLISDLSSSGRHGQEISVGAYVKGEERGWMVKIFSCFDAHERLIYIPSNLTIASYEEVREEVNG